MPGRRPGSLKTLETLGELMQEVSDMLEKSLSERDRALDHVGRSLAHFEATESALKAELAELPPELDAYLRLVRDKRKMEARRKALEAQSISHALNFHLGGGENAGVVWGGAGPSIMDELRAEEEDLDRQRQEALEDEETLKEHLDWEATTGGEGGGEVRTKKKKKKQKQKQKPVDSYAPQRPPARSEKAEAEAEAYMRFNMRDGLFAHLDAANERETELESLVEASPEGSLSRLDAEDELARFRAKRNDEVADFFAGYNPQRVLRGKEEPLAGLGLALEDPAEVVASVERRHLEAAAYAEGFFLSELGLSPTKSPRSPADGGFAQGSFGGGGGDAPMPLWGAPRPLSRGGLSPPSEGGLGGRPASSGGGGRSMLQERGHGGRHGQRGIPGVGVAQKFSDHTVGDPYTGRGILDLPSYGSASSPKRSAEAGSDASPSHRGGGGGAFDDIRSTVQENTQPMDLTFPTLEFRRRKQQDRNATYFSPGDMPRPYPVAQTEGAVWSSMARERRVIEAEERRRNLEAQRGGGSTGTDTEQTKKKKRGTKKKKPVEVDDTTSASSVLEGGALGSLGPVDEAGDGKANR